MEQILGVGQSVRRAACMQCSGVRVTSADWMGNSELALSCRRLQIPGDTYDK